MGIIGWIIMIVIAGGVGLGVSRYVIDFFITGTSFSTNVTGGANMTDIAGNSYTFTGNQYGNNTIHYIVPLAIAISVLCLIFMVVRKKRRGV